MSQPPPPPPPPPPYGPPVPGQLVPGQRVPGQPGAVPPGYGPPPYSAPPPQLLVAQRIPEDQPFVVRASVGKRIAQFALLGVLILVLLSCPLAAVVAGAPGGSTTAEMLPLLLGVGLLGGVVICGLLALQVYLLTSGGPVLAVGPQGLWIKTRPTRGQAMWLPWEAIARIYRRRWSLEKMVCVQPHDPRVGSGLGSYTAVDSAAQQLFFGSRLAATVNFADRPESEIMGALAHFAAGRSRIE